MVEEENEMNWNMKLTFWWLAMWLLGGKME